MVVTLRVREQFLEQFCWSAEPFSVFSCCSIPVTVHEPFEEKKFNNNNNNNNALIMRHLSRQAYSEAQKHETYYYNNHNK